MNAPPSTRAPLGAVYAAVLIIQLVMNGARPMVSYRALALGADNFDLGVISASFAALSVLVAVPIGNAIVGRGARWFVVASCVISAASCAGLAFATSLVLIMVLQAILGLAMVMGPIAFQTIVANAGSDSTADARFGIFAAFVSLGQMIGPAGAGAVATAAIGLGWYTSADEQATTAVFVVLAGVSVVGIVCALAIKERRSEAPEDSRRVARREVIGTLRVKGMPRALFASVAVLSVVDILTIYLPSWGNEKGWSVAAVGGILAARAGGSLVVRLFLQQIIDRWGRRLPLTVGNSLAALALAMVPLIPVPWPLFIMMAATGVVLGMGQPMTMSWVSRSVPMRLRSTALAIRLGGNRMGNLLAPVAVGAVAGVTGSIAIFVILAVLMASAAGAIGTSNIDDVTNRSS